MYCEEMADLLPPLPVGTLDVYSVEALAADIGIGDSSSDGWEHDLLEAHIDLLCDEEDDALSYLWKPYAQIFDWRDID